MSLLVNGMSIPNDDYKHRDVTLDRTTDDGTLWLSVYDFDSEAMNYSCRSYPLSEIPTPHGRLIEENDVLREIRRFKGYLDEDMIWRIEFAIKNRTKTIIEAENIK